MKVIRDRFTNAIGKVLIPMSIASIILLMQNVQVLNVLFMKTIAQQAPHRVIRIACYGVFAYKSVPLMETASRSTYETAFGSALHFIFWPVCPLWKPFR